MTISSRHDRRASARDLQAFVLKPTGLSRSTLYRKVSVGGFPKPVQIGTRCVGWRESAIQAWMRNPMFYDASAGD